MSSERHEGAAENPLARIRVGDAERDSVVETLNTAVGQGRITPEEFDERLTATLAAKTFGELDSIVVDLPVPPPSAAHGPASNHTPATVGRAGEQLVLRASWDNEKRTGRWTVPESIRSEAVSASVILDFLQATTPHRVIDIEISGGMGATTLIVPVEWGVNTDMLSKSWGTIRNQVSQEPTGGAPLIKVWGSLGMGSLTARHANYFERRRLEKQ